MARRIEGGVERASQKKATLTDFTNPLLFGLIVCFGDSYLEYFLRIKLFFKTITGWIFNKMLIR